MIQQCFKQADGVWVMGEYTNAKCKYCGKPFFKTHHSIVYCSDTCRTYALREQKAKYQRKRRKLINTGELVSNENKYLGTQFLSGHRQSDFSKEYSAIRKEMRRLRLR